MLVIGAVIVSVPVYGLYTVMYELSGPGGTVVSAPVPSPAEVGVWAIGTGVSIMTVPGWPLTPSIVVTVTGTVIESAPI
jgi:hypothetical protein